MSVSKSKKDTCTYSISLVGKHLVYQNIRLNTRNQARKLHELAHNRFTLSPGLPELHNGEVSPLPFKELHETLYNGDLTEPDSRYLQHLTNFSFPAFMGKHTEEIAWMVHQLALNNISEPLVLEFSFKEALQIGF